MPAPRSRGGFSQAEYPPGVTLHTVPIVSKKTGVLVASAPTGDAQSPTIVLVEMAKNGQLKKSVTFNTGQRSVLRL